MPLFLDLDKKRYVHVEPERDLLIILGSAVLFFFLRRFCDHYVFEHLAKLMGCPDKKLLKYKQNAWYSLYYTTFTILGYVILWNDSWVWDPAQIYGGYPTEMAKDSIANPYLRPYYLAELGFYLQALYSHLLLDAKLNDFHILTIHHLFTIFLISVSIVIGMHRVGSWILLLHDIVDVFLYTAKFFKDAKWETCATVWFGLFVLSYAWCRLYKYGGIVIMTAMIIYGPRATVYEGTMNWFVRYDPEAWQPIELTSRGTCLYSYCISTFWALLFAQISLLLMHIYWFSLILRIVKRILIKHKLGEDIREKDERTDSSSSKLNTKVKNTK